jgi:HEPN domain-containing protein
VGISAATLKGLAEARLEDARILLKGTRYDGAVYLCGYSIELALKASICKHMQWTEFPDDKKAYSNFKTHNLDVLLDLSGREADIKNKHLADWSVVVAWDPELRYRQIGSATPQEVETMIDSSDALLKELL